ncbi:MAG: site-specific DNA-methyltransferase [Acidobacteriota bacterium]|nr:site-specific DNA-methyltransferase [Acidobacteriota bacterium]
MHVVDMPIASLVNFSNNARTHSKRQIRQIADSIREFGFTNPVLLGNGDNTIIAGHGRVQAAKLLGMTQVPTILLAHLTKDQIRAYVLADNKISLSAGWNESILAIELQHLLTIQTDLDITVTGFEVPEIDLILQQASEVPDQENDVDASLHAGPAVSELGDLWALGDHRIFCGNSLHEASFTSLLNGKQADMILCDPPYGIPISGFVTGNGSTKHREFAMGCGEMTSEEFVQFLTQALQMLARHSKDGSVHFVFMSWHHLQELLVAGQEVYDALLNIVVWAKDRAGMGSLYRSQHELCPIFRKGKNSHRNNVQLGRYGRNRTNVWTYPGSQTLSKQGVERDLLSLHPTIKPTAMLADAILDCSARGDLVLDSFLGSGSTLLAAERVGRICCGIEIDPLYVDLAIRRWERSTGRSAIHTGTGKSFEEISAAREVNCAL